MNIDIKKLILNLIIPHWRWNRLVSYIYALAAPLRLLYADLCSFRDDINYKVKYNGQVCHLTKVLNDRFDPSVHGIQVIPAGGLERTYIAPRADNKEVYTSFYVASRAYYSDYSGYDFIVLVPNGLLLESEKSELSGLLNYYKIAGKTPCIIYL